MDFEGGDRELNGGYEICWRDRGKNIIACYPVLIGIQFCAEAVGNDVVNLTYQGLARTEVRGKVLVVYSLSHAPVLLICDFEKG